MWEAISSRAKHFGCHEWRIVFHEYQYPTATSSISLGALPFKNIAMP